MVKSGTVAALCAALCLFAAAHADVEGFFGNWQNDASDQSGIAHVQISPAGGNLVSVRLYGKCHPSECDWGMVEGHSYAPDPASSDVEAVSASFAAGFARREVIFRREPDGLGFELLTNFTDGSGRHDFVIRGHLVHSAWAGPVGQSWDRAASQSTGWGGGARSGAVRKPIESCAAFPALAARAIPSGTDFKVMAGGLTLAEADERGARRVLDVIRHYRFDNKCQIGSVTYWKGGETIPGGWGADCIAFNPTTVHGVLMGHAWKIVDGTQWIADLGGKKADADQLLALIRFYGLNRECFAARPAMVYWLAH